MSTALLLKTGSAASAAFAIRMFASMCMKSRRSLPDHLSQHPEVVGRYPALVYAISDFDEVNASSLMREIKIIHDWDTSGAKDAQWKINRKITECMQMVQKLCSKQCSRASSCADDVYKEIELTELAAQIKGHFEDILKNHLLNVT